MAPSGEAFGGHRLLVGWARPTNSLPCRAIKRTTPMPYEDYVIGRLQKFITGGSPIIGRGRRAYTRRLRLARPDHADLWPACNRTSAQPARPLAMTEHRQHHYAPRVACSRCTQREHALRIGCVCAVALAPVFGWPVAPSVLFPPTSSWNGCRARRNRPPRRTASAFRRLG